MDEVGERFSSGALFIPEMLRAAMAMKAGIEILKPHLTDSQSQTKGIVVIGIGNGTMNSGYLGQGVFIDK